MKRHGHINALVLLAVLSSFLFFPGESLHPENIRKPQKLALLVGISSYSRGRGAGLDWPDINGARDVALLQKTLVECADFLPGDVQVLSDEKATHQGIIEAFENHLIARAKPGDSVVFHFSGHGQLIRDETGRKMTGVDECFVPYDYGVQGVRVMKDNPRLRGYEINRLMAELSDRMGENGRVKGDILVVLDTCHAGTGIRALMRARGRDWDENYDGPRPQAHPSSANRAGVPAVSSPECIFVAACKSNQSAKEDPDTHMGYLSENLIRAIEQARPDSTYRDIFERIESNIVALNIEQDPRLEGNPDRVLFSGAVKPHLPYFVVKVLDTPDMVQIPAGYLQGVTEGSIYTLYKAGSSVDVPENKMAEITVTSVNPYTSEARVTGRFSPIASDTLSSARATLLGHNYQSSLKIFLDGVAAGTLTENGLLNITKGDRANYDIRIFRKKDLTVLERADGSIVSEIHTMGSETGKTLSTALLAEWKKRFLMSLHCDDLKVDIRLIRVPVDEKNRTETGEGEAVKANALSLRGGDFISFEVCNRSEDRVFINILHIDPHAKISPLFPNPAGTFYEDIVQSDRDSVPPDGKWYRIPINVSSAHRREYIWKTEVTRGPEMVKVIATPDRIDLASLFSREDASFRAVSGETPNPLNPFSLLSAGSGTAMRAIEIFGTAEVLFEVK